MGEMLRLRAADGHELGAYRAASKGTPRGSVVVLQEIFGVNSHIRNVCDRFAAEGYVAIAPALFDRFQRDFESGYSPEEIAVARGFMGSLDWEALIADTRAAMDRVLTETSPVSVVGFCLGGSLAYVAAIRFGDLASAIGYYGGKVVTHADTKPLCPVMLHFGEIDQSIPLSDVEIIRGKRPDIEIYTYPAGHGFNCDERGAYNAEQAAIAWERTLGLLEKVHGPKP